MSTDPPPEPGRKVRFPALAARLKFGRVLPATTVAVLCAIAGSAIGLLVVPRAPSPDDDQAEAPEVELAGERLTPGPQGLSLAEARLQTFSKATFSLSLPGQAPVTQSLSTWGGTADLERLQTLLRDAGDASSPLRRHQAQVADSSEDNSEGGPLLTLPTPYQLDPEIAVEQLLLIKDRFDRRATDARLDIAKGGIIAHQTGRWLDIDATLQKIDLALSEGKLSAEAVVTTENPRVLLDSLKGLKFSTVLGHFETTYSRAKNAADRTYNLKLAAQKLDGTVVMPGEVFDFNEIVGARDEANGYKVATVIADGELVDGIGGGTCQISGTLHGAVFFGGLDIVERYPHTRPSSYIKMGMDATVVYPTINFRFKNPYDFPIAVHQTVEGGKVRAEILGPIQDQVVTLIRRVDEAIPYEQIERKDPRLAQGTRILAQRGIPGFRLHRYRTIRRGSHTRREKWRDVYPPTDQVVRIGTGPATAEKRSSVTTPEYTADEVLILTQRRPEDGKPGDFSENREAGKFGQAGWTKDAGMPFWIEN